VISIGDDRFQFLKGTQGNYFWSEEVEKWRSGEVEKAKGPEVSGLRKKRAAKGKNSKHQTPNHPSMFHV
jgi:hypothetical protein